jgi:hypothetical protein
MCQQASRLSILKASSSRSRSFSEAYENSVEQRMLAEVEVQKLRQNAAREEVQADECANYD